MKSDTQVTDGGKKGRVKEPMRDKLKVLKLLSAAKLNDLSLSRV